jgi:hypothetical protein
MKSQIDAELETEPSPTPVGMYLVALKIMTWLASSIPPRATLLPAREVQDAVVAKDNEAHPSSWHLQDSIFDERESGFHITSTQ